jgi:hypothetical protein
MDGYGYCPFRNSDEQTRTEYERLHIYTSLINPDSDIAYMLHLTLEQLLSDHLSSLAVHQMPLSSIPMNHGSVYASSK